MFPMIRKKDEDQQRSEAIFHHKEELGMPAGKIPDNYKPHWSERAEQTRPRELFSMGSSYGDVSVAANLNKEMTLAVSEKRRHNSATLSGDHKKLNGERRRSVAGPLGWTFTNSHDPQNSAIVFKTRKLLPARRVLAEIKKHAQKDGPGTLETILPFFSLSRDRKRLQELINKTGIAGKEGKDLFGLEDEKEQLSRIILQKEQLQSRFLKRLHLSLGKARAITDKGHAEWLKTTFEDSKNISGEPPVEEENETSGGLNNDAQKGTQTKKE